MKQKTEIYYDETGDMLEVLIGKSAKGYFQEMENGIFIRKSEKEGKTIGFMVFAFKKRLEKNLNVSYDKARDILEINLGRETERYEKELGEKIFIHIDRKTEKIKGFMIEAFKKRIINLNFYDIPLEEPPLTL